MFEDQHIIATVFAPALRLFSFLLALAAFSLPLVFSVPAHADGPAPTRLRCEDRANPLGVDSPQPRLSWIMQAPPQVRDVHQTAYHLLVASSPALLAKGLGDIWDSGAVASRETSQIACAGRPLHSGQQAWWKVRIVDQAGKTSAWSAPGSWTMGVLHEADWHGAKWIGAAQVTEQVSGTGGQQTDSLLLRRRFSVQPHLTRALGFVCGLGQYEMTINGSKITDQVLTPGWTLYTKTCLYDTYDLTPLLHPGVNTAGLFLGNGMYNIHPGRYTKITGSFGPQRAICLLQLTYQDGTVEYITTDKKWRTSPGPITFSSVYGGEDYDGRLLPAGWDQAGFDDSRWNVPVITAGPGGVLKGTSCAGLPIRSFAVLTPISRRQLTPATVVCDLGQNASLMIRLQVEGPAGSSVKITPSELIGPDGDINDTMCDGNSYWRYTLSGRGIETYQSKFYYRGGRYLKVEAIPAPNSTVLPVVKSLSGDFIHADAPEVGHFSSSSDLYNKIFELVRWAQMNNMVSILTDCPTREKLGWLEECHLNGPALRYNFDLAPLMTKITNDMADSQRDTGLVPSTCPDYPQWGNEDRFVIPPEWGSACIAVPWQQYQFEGDLALLRRSYPMMKRYVGYLDARAENHIVSFGLGDWGASQATPIELTATAFYYYDTRTLAKIASLLGEMQDASRYTQQAGAILSAYNVTFFHPATSSYATGSQASNAVSLAMDMVAPDDRPAVLKSLEDDLKAEGSKAGEVSLKSVLDSLAEAGQSDLIHSVYGSETSGYGLQVKQGKTSLTESWNGGDANSQDHFMFGQINEWFYRFLAGIQEDPSVPGFRKIVIRPALVPGLASVSARYDSRQGLIESEWKKDGGTVSLSVVIPANTTATIYVPARDRHSVRESGKPITFRPGIAFLRYTEGAAVYQVGSGHYHFTAAIAP